MPDANCGEMMNLLTGVAPVSLEFLCDRGPYGSFCGLPGQPHRVGFNKRNLPNSQCAAPRPTSHGGMVQTREDLYARNSVVTLCGWIAGPTRPREIDCQLQC